MSRAAVTVRQALPADAARIHALVEPYAVRRILIAKELINYYEAIGEFVVAEAQGEIVGCGALHVMWRDLAEIRTLAVRADYLRRGVGRALVEELIRRAHAFDLQRIFCLTFETEFFAAHGFTEIEGIPVDDATYCQLLRSHDDGVAEFLDLARVKPNTLGNTRMMAYLHAKAT